MAEVLVAIHQDTLKNRANSTDVQLTLAGASLAEVHMVFRVEFVVLTLAVASSSFFASTDGFQNHCKHRGSIEQAQMQAPCWATPDHAA